MVSRIAIGPDETERIEQVLRDEIREKREDGMIDPIFKVRSLGGNDITIVEDGKTIEIPERFQVLSIQLLEEQSKRSCQMLFSSFGATDLFCRLDELLSKALTCNWQLNEEDPQETVQRTCRILERLPRNPPMMIDHAFDAYRDISTSHLLNHDIDRTWANLQVTTLLDRNTIRLAIYIILRRAKSSKKTHQGELTLEYVNMLAELFEAADHLSSAEPCLVKKQHWFLIKAFLWTTWHRSMLLHLSGRLSSDLRYGTTLFPVADCLEFRGASTFLRHAPSQVIPESMCRWAFELIRTDRVAIVLDLRLLCQRYKAFSETCRAQPRCLVSNGETTQCEGSSPYACKRFTQMQVEDQSAHAPLYSEKCSRMYWNETSFRTIHGAKAISIHENVEGGLKYCLASDKTMTISHVWSHGQGGRPESNESGLNLCLHHRYCLLAQTNGCDSYWIDTACIPKDRTLRREAIGRINDIFRDSRLTLICDKDIMAVDITDFTIEKKETLLSVLLVSDWNVRAWTLLEAMRGKSNLHLLCKDDKNVPLRSLVDDVNQKGSAEIASIFVTAKHLLPTRHVREIRPRQEYTEQEWHRIQGFLRPEEAACMLGRRYASRDGDDVITWALLCGDTAQKTAEEFWLAQEAIEDFSPEKSVYTGFLVSSAPRIANQHGFGWAPCLPSISYKTMTHKSEVFDVYDGQDTRPGYYSTQGLRARWLVHEAPSWGLRFKKWVSPITGATSSHFDDIVLSCLKRFRRVAILKPVLTDRFRSLMTDVARLITLTEDGLRRHAIVMVGSNDGRSWSWLGVQGLDDQTFNSLEFVEEEITIV